MKKLIGALVALAMLTLNMLPADAQAKPKTYVVCQINGTAGTTALVQTMKATSATFTVSATGPEGSLYWSVYELATPTSCETLLTDASSSVPFPAGINLEADTSHKPTLK